MAGASKLAGAEAHVEHFAHWGYPGWFRIVVGAIETIPAVLLIVLRTVAFGAAGIVTIMLGATYTHLFRAEGEASRSLFTVTLLILAVGPRT